MTRRAVVRRWLGFAMVTVVLASGCQTARGFNSAPTPSSVSPGDQVVKLDVNGTARQFVLVVPAGITRPRPVVIFIHGARSTAPQVQSLLGFDALAARHRIVTVYPESVTPNGGWRSGCCNAKVDTDADLSFIRAIIDTLVARHVANSKHVVVAGFSAGALLTYSVACHLARQVSAVVSVAGTMLNVPASVGKQASLAACSPKRPVSVYEIHGTSDSVLPLNGVSSCSSTPCGPGSQGWEPAVPTVSAWWRALDGCRPHPASAAGVPGRFSDTVYACRAHTQVGLALVAGVGHDLGGLDAGFHVRATLAALALGRRPAW